MSMSLIIGIVIWFTVGFIASIIEERKRPKDLPLDLRIVGSILIQGLGPFGLLLVLTQDTKKG